MLLPELKKLEGDFKSASAELAQAQLAYRNIGIATKRVSVLVYVMRAVDHPRRAPERVDICVTVVFLSLSIPYCCAICPSGSGTIADRCLIQNDRVRRPAQLIYLKLRLRINETIKVEGSR